MIFTKARVQPVHTNDGPNMPPKSKGLLHHINGDLPKKQKEPYLKSIASLCPGTQGRH